MKIMGSKKATITTAGAALVVILGAVLPLLGITEEITQASQDLVKSAALLIALIVSTYNVGQGIADHGKEKAKVEAENSQ